VNKTSRPLASTLPCLFAELVDIYSKSHDLKSCEIKINQSWRWTSEKAVMKRVQLFTKYFPELSSLSNSLDYNQTVL